MKKYIIALFALTCVTPAFAQRTSGGSTQTWRRYDVQYDTTYNTITENVRYPSTSNAYIRIGLVKGRGLWSEPSLGGWPEDGFKGINGSDATSGFELFFGGWTNMTEVNKNLHPAIDLSTIFEMGVQFYQRELSTDTAALGYDVDYALTGGLSTRLGIGATIKPTLFTSTSVPTSNSLLIDVGVTIGFDMYGSGQTTYSNPSGNNGYFEYDDESFIGMRLNANLHLGVRYKFVGFYVEVGNDLLHLIDPSYDHYYNSTLIENFDEDVKYNTVTYGISFHF